MLKPYSCLASSEDVTSYLAPGGKLHLQEVKAPCVGETERDYQEELGRENTVEGVCSQFISFPFFKLTSSVFLSILFIRCSETKKSLN